MKAIHVLLISIFITMSMTSNAQNDKNRSEMGKVCRVYSGEGVYVTTCRIGPEKNNESLILVNGLDHPWNEKIWKAKVLKNNENFDYQIQLDGKPFIIFTYRSNYYSYTVYLKDFGGEKNEQSVSYDKDESNACSPEIFLNQYLEQQSKK